ncbi:MAG: aldehyde dehydrogenase family protein [Myxococcales bacterium]|nr:aldehyde dehydrogenase family protein [Myxococcales bacterium]
MQSASMELSASAQSRTATSQAELDKYLAILSENATPFARLAPREKAALLRACVPRLLAVAKDWVAAACKAKGLRLDSSSAGEEWLGGPYVTMRCLRKLIMGLDQIQALGKPTLPSGAIRVAADGRTEVLVMPGEAYDHAISAGFTCRLRMEKGWDDRKVREQQAIFYSKRDPVGGVSLILGAGNVASIPPTDALYKMFHEGMLCIVKLNPVNEYLGPFYEQAFQPLIERGYLRFVYGGAEVGSYLSYHPQIVDVHITGSDRTHDLIVWGPPGEERSRRQAANDPLLKKNITSELGCVTPVMIVPGRYSASELRMLAENIVTQVVNNGSFNCNAAKILMLSESWPQRQELLKTVQEIFQEIPTRRAYYPGAQDRFAKLTAGKTVTRLGQAVEGTLPWTLIRDVSSKNPDEMLFSTEPFCSIISEVTLSESDPAEFVTAAARFANERLWGTLSCSMYVAPATEKQPDVQAAIEKACDVLRYGVVAINHWPAVAYGAMTPPWGGHPSGTLLDIQSGIGFVHNTFMFEGIEKAILRGPLAPSPKPPWFVTHKRSHEVAERMLRFEAEPSWLKIPAIAFHALAGS